MSERLIDDALVEKALDIWFKANRAALGEPFGDDHREDMGAVLSAVVPVIVERCAKAVDAFADDRWCAGDRLAECGRSTNLVETQYETAKILAAAIRADKGGGPDA